MSRAYRISVKESLSRHVQVDDGVSSNLELLPILQKERMRELLAHELEQRGFKRDGATASRSEGDGITTTVDLDTGTVDVVAEGHAELALEAERTAVVDLDRAGADEAKLKATAQRQLEAEAQAKTDELRRAVTGKLEGKLKDLKGELDGAVNRVTANALKQRAAELGTVEEVHEDASGGLTIKVRV